MRRGDIVEGADGSIFIVEGEVPTADRWDGHFLWQGSAVLRLAPVMLAYSSSEQWRLYQGQDDYLVPKVIGRCNLD